MSKTVVAITGNQAVAYAMKQINPDVVAAFPITPQTAIMQKFSSYVADGTVDSEFIRVESEHSAMSATVGASAAGVRAMTATSSVGLALMFEVLGVATGCRLPIVMPVVNRALSAPINIHCDHSDTMGCREQGWIQIYSENNQEAYENTLLALRLAEHKDVLLPVMVCLDGFVTSHGVENVQLYNDKDVKKFIGEYKAHKPLLDLNNPVTIGPLALQNYYFESKRQQIQAMEHAKKVYLEVGKELSKTTGNNYPYFEEYMTEDAQVVVVTMSSTAGTTKTVINKMRASGKKVGLVKIKLFRPFPHQELGKILTKFKFVTVLDRAVSLGSEAPLFTEIKLSLYDKATRPKLHSCMFGLGGRDIYEDQIEESFNQMLESKAEDISYLGCRE